MLRISACVLALLLAAPAARAQFSTFEWTLLEHGEISASVAGDGMGFSAASFLGTVPGSLATFLTTAPVAGRVSVLANFWTEELVCGSSWAYRVVGASPSVFSTCSYFDELVFDVGDAQAFGFGLQCNNPAWSASLSLTQLVFTPYWATLGGGLAGSGGMPALSGHGILQPDEAMAVELASAAPAAVVTLVVGLGEASLPFKGGVLVPSPDALVHGLVTDAAGALQLAGTWPHGVPAGSALLLQAWIADASGPQGFTASNALQASAL
jgi:hypothetical protein